MEVLKDKDCTIETPVTFGNPDIPVYGQGIRIFPWVEGRRYTKHFRDIYLDELLPLEDYDLIVVLFSGGKDSTACFLKLLELGVPKEKIELWHHDIDGGNPIRHMDWRCTNNYVKSFAEAEGVKIRISYRVNGFFGELYRIGASEPVEWIDTESEAVKRCRYSSNYLKCQEIKRQASEEMEELLKQYGCRLKFPAKSPDLSKRWCSAYLKIAVADSVMSNLEKTRTDARILIVSGERRGESAGRAKYNEMEIHRSNAVKRNNRLVHQWRCCIDYTEKDVWEIIKRHHINPHPCYRLGWNRCSCAACIFSTPTLMAGYKELYPEEFRLLCEDEERLGFTIDNKMCLEEYISGAKSCLDTSDKQALYAVLTGEYSVEDIFVADWHYPVGAFHGAEGGSC